jgi:hypothetical protein
MATSFDFIKSLNSGGLTINSVPSKQSFVGPVAPKRNPVVSGISTTAPTVKRYTAPATSAPTSKPGPALPPIPTPPMPTPANNVSAPVAPAEPEQYTDPVQEYYDSLDRTAPTADDQAKIREDARKAMQAYIDSINSYYAGLVGQEQQAGEGRLGQTRAINARSGLMGSDFGEANTAETRKYNEANVKALQDEQNVRIQEVNGKIDQRARDEIAAQKAQALGNSEKYITRLSQNQESARNDLKTLAKSGAAMDKTKLQVLQKQTGYDPLTFESIYNANKPVPEYTAPMQLKDGTLVITDKATGEVKNLGKYDLPNNFDFLFAPDGTPMVFDKDTGITQVASGFRKGQFAKPQSTSEKDTRTASQKEYEYAKTQGYDKSFMDYQKEVKATSREL